MKEILIIMISNEFIVIFMVYSCIGAIYEHICYNIIGKHCEKGYKPKVLDNPIITGFPLYGIGGYCVVSLKTFLLDYHINNLLVHFLIYASILTIFEYIVGKLAGAGPNNNNNIDLWDYSNIWCNYQGIISIKHFFIWGTLSICVYYVHPILFNCVSECLS